MSDEEEQLRRSWSANAPAWTETVREQRIESRRVATDDAILDAVLALHPHTVLDLGCGEGWLARALAARGVNVTGVDASPQLIEAARQLGGGEFRVAAYDDLGLDTHYDVVVANFSLLEEELEPLLRTLRDWCGTLIIQTVHPWSSEPPYEDGWRVETFASMGGEWPEPMPWFFRTFASWIRIFRDTGYSLEAVREPLHPEHRRPVSILFVLQRRG